MVETLQNLELDSIIQVSQDAFCKLGFVREIDGITFDEAYQHRVDSPGKIPWAILDITGMPDTGRLDFGP